MPRRVSGGRDVRAVEMAEVSGVALADDVGGGRAAARAVEETLVARSERGGRAGPPPDHLIHRALLHTDVATDRQICQSIYNQRNIKQ